MRGRLPGSTVLLLAALIAPVPAYALSGDVTGDGVFDLRDSLALCQFLAGTRPSLPVPRNGDVNFDGVVNAADLDLMMQGILGAPLPSPPLSVTPMSLDFGDVGVGSDSTLDVTLSNGGASLITINSIAFGAGTSGDFTIVSAPATPAPLAPGGSVVVTVRYAPSDAGTDSGALAILGSGGDAQVLLTGEGVSAFLSVTPLNLGFGDVVVGDESVLTATVENVGGSSLTVNSIAPGPGTSPDFTILLAPSTPFALAPGQQHQISVRYAPAQAGDDSGTIEILSTAGAAAIALSGRGLAPALDVSPLALLFGNVLVGRSVTRSTIITNAGSAPLEVTGVALRLGTSPDFSLGTLPPTPFTVAPGATQQVDVTYAPSGVGPDSGEVEIRTNAGDALATLSGNGVAPDIDVAPQSVSFGNVLIGQTATRTIEIINAGTADLTVSAIATLAGGSGAITLQNLPTLPAVVPPGSSVIVDVVYAPAAVGADSATVEIASDDPVTPTVNVPVTGNGVSPALLIQPNTLTFSNVRAGQSLDLSFTITNSGTSDLVVNAVAIGSGSSPDFAIIPPPATPVTLAAGDSLPVTIRYAPPTAGPDGGAVEIATSAGTAQVTLAGSAIAPEIEVAPAALAFGNVRVGLSATLQISIRNTGSATLNVATIAIGGSADFTLSGVPVLPAAIVPGGEIILSVTYLPGQTGSDTGAITIGSDDDDEPTTTVGLEGEGVAPVLQVTPAALSFGDVTVGAGRTLSIAIRNTGTADLHIASVTLGAGSSTEFSVGAPLLATVPPGGSTNVSVTYTPADLVDDTGTVEIASDGGSAAVSLAGRGTNVVTVAFLALSEASLSLATGECAQIRAIATLTNGQGLDVTGAASWSSLDPSAAAVGSTGLVSALAVGATTVSASYGGFTASAAVTVDPAGTLRIALPCGEVAPGATFTAEVTVDAGARPLGAYAIRIGYDPAVVRITGIVGGVTGPFAVDPGASPSSFGTGTTLIAAYQNASVTQPSGVVSAARVSFEVVGAAGASTAVSLQAVTLAATDLTDIVWTNIPARVVVTP